MGIEPDATRKRGPVSSGAPGLCADAADTAAGRGTGLDGKLTRRSVLGGLAAAAVPGAAFGQAAVMRPVPRPASSAAATVAAPRLTGADDLVSEAALGGAVAFAVADLATGAMIDGRGDDVPMPPASTAKVITTLFALTRLPRDHVFETRLLVTGPVTGGRVAGDLVLAGGGDPTISTDNLGDIAARLRAAGVRGVDGRFLVAGGALPYLRAIDRAQKVHFGYNPSVSGLNVNFNRVNMVWTRGPDGPLLSMDARGERFVPPVHVARARVADRETPVFTYSDLDGLEDWTVARPALVRDGSRWLPVRHPERYAGDVFRTLAKAQGIDMPAALVADAVPDGQTLVTLKSDPLTTVIRDMLKYSTNLTAEAVGMAAGLKAGATGHDGTVARMRDWFTAATGGARADLVDHSGLGGASRMTPAAMLSALTLLGPKAGLRGLMKDIPLGEKGKPVPRYRVQAKTGTLNFVSSLAGYMTTAKGRELAFAIFTGDPARRDAAMADDSERPVGSVSWTKRSKRLQGQLLERWAAMADA